MAPGEWRSSGRDMSGEGLYAVVDDAAALDLGLGREGLFGAGIGAEGPEKRG